MDKNRINAEQDFLQFAEIAQNTTANEFMNPAYIDIMNRALAVNTRIEALIITTPDGEYAFEKQRGNAVIWVNNSPRFINKFSFSNQKHIRLLQIQNLRNVTISAVATAYDYNDFTKILKETLLIIMVGLAIAFFTMLLQILTDNQPALTRKPKTADTFSDADADADSDTYTDSDAGPKGLYSKRSNIGWEEYTKDRLDSEIHRCSSTEKDLSLILLEFTDLTNDDMFKQSTEEAVSFLSSRDLLFEHTRWGIAAILPGTSLETAISKSEKYYQHILEKFPRGYNSSSSICIGITSRSGRLLNASRLMLEAREALRKAKSDPKSPIIAFKSDPEKYREFIRTKTS